MNFHNETSSVITGTYETKCKSTAVFTMQEVIDALDGFDEVQKDPDYLVSDREHVSDDDIARPCNSSDVMWKSLI